jgi:Family of unknown function (DUF6184)
VHGGARMQTTSTVFATSFAFGFLVACGGQSSQNPPSAAPNAVPGSAIPSGVTAAQNAVDQKSVERIADARCDHEQKCNGIGQGQTYASREDCKQKLVSDTSNDLNATSCPHGLDQDALNRCVNAISNEQCSVSLDTLSRMADCRSGVICMK